MTRARQQRRYRLGDPAITRLPMPITDESRDPARPGRDIAYTGRCVTCGGGIEDDHPLSCSQRCEAVRIARESRDLRGAA